MTDKFKSLDKFLNLFLIFLFPTQLAFHFWPVFSLIFGIRVDYLSPTIYVTDILFFVLFVWWLTKSKEVFFEDVNRCKLTLLLLLVVSCLNIAFSVSHMVSFIKWIKIFEFLALGYYTFKRKELFKIETVARVIFYSLLFVSLIGLLQFINGKTSGNIFYLVGERNFSIYTPGIALGSMLGKSYLRVYSTFPHPNSLAGFLGVSLLFMLPNLRLKNRWIKILGLSLISVLFILTFSLSAFVGLAICFFIYLNRRKTLLNQKYIVYIMSFILLASLLLSLFSKKIIINNPDLPQSISQRLELADVAGTIFSQNWLIGTGLNTFVIKEIDFAKYINSVWFLQPVHNIYLLIFSEVGVLGISLFIYLFYKLFSACIKTNNQWGILIMIFILMTGLFDHYWFTIQQNLLIASFFLGLMLRKSKAS